MNTIEAYEQEIRYQIDDLPRFIREFNIKRLSIKDQKRCIYTGAGDSFAAAMIAEYASDHKAQCVDPMDICLNPSIIENRLLYVLSISGSTRGNIEAAKIASKRAIKTVAITANTKSKLANICHEVIELRYRNSGTLTAGSIGFTVSMLACLSLLRRTQIGNMKALFRRAEIEARNADLSGHVYVLGSSITYPLAAYGSAKIFEVLGMKAQYALLEQFCHMELFSIRKGDTVLVLSNEKKASDLYTKLKDDGYNVFVFEPIGKTLEANLVYYSILLQLIVLYNAKASKLDECYFITNDKLRKISSSLIY